MHVQIINFNLKNMTPEDYQALCEQIAPAFAEVPGLVSKTWLSDRNANTYGGIYVWRDAGSQQAFSYSELFQTVINHPNLVNISSRNFEMIDAPGKVTRSLAEMTD